MVIELLISLFRFSLREPLSLDQACLALQYQVYSSVKPRVLTTTRQFKIIAFRRGFFRGVGGSVLVKIENIN